MSELKSAGLLDLLAAAKVMMVRVFLGQCVNASRRPSKISQGFNVCRAHHLCGGSTLFLDVDGRCGRCVVPWERPEFEALKNKGP